MKWAKKLKTENGQNMLSSPFSHDVAQVVIRDAKDGKFYWLPPQKENTVVQNNNYFEPKPFRWKLSAL